MTSFTVRRATDRVGWDEFVRRAGDSDCFLQSWQWGEFQAATGRQVMRFEVVNGDRRVAVCLLVPHVTKLRRSFLLAPAGPIIDPALAPAEQTVVWQEFIRTLSAQRPAGTMFVKFEPNRAPAEPLSMVPGTGVHPETTLLLDLRLSEDALAAALHAKTRYNINLARRKGVTVRWSRNSDDVEAFLQLLAQTSERQGIGIYPARYYRTMVASLGPMIEVAVATHQGVPLAAGLMIHFGSTLTYLHGASNYEQRELMAPYAMHWETIKRGQQMGETTYDFFGIAPEGSLSHRWAGITRFKRGFGGAVRKYPGAYNLVYDRGWYLAYRLAKRMAGR